MQRIKSYPVRPLTPDERALVAEWFASAGDVPSAYVSNRQSDDPEIYHRVVVTITPGGPPTHLVQALRGRDIWIMFTSGERTRLRRFRSLAAALNSIRPVLTERHQPMAKAASR